MTNKKHKKMKAVTRIMIFLGIGFVFAMVSMSIAIYFGYSKAYNHEVNCTSVKLLGLKIYQLVKHGNKYNGKSIGTNMGIICMIYMLAVVSIEEVLRKILSRKRN